MLAYEPYFSATAKFVGIEQHGVSDLQIFDPLERVVAVLHPNHTYENVVYDAWRQISFDVNDTVTAASGTRRSGACDLREQAAGLSALGMQLEPHLTKGFVHFMKADLDADKSTIRRVLKPNQTTLIDVVMKRVVREGVMRLQRLDRRDNTSFANDPVGVPISEES